MGPMQDMTFTEIQSAFPGARYDHCHRPSEYRIRGGETYYDVRNQAQCFFSGFA